jgi:hypothetical protein
MRLSAALVLVAFSASLAPQSQCPLRSNRPIDSPSQRRQRCEHALMSPPTALRRQATDALLETKLEPRRLQPLRLRIRFPPSSRRRPRALTM